MTSDPPAPNSEPCATSRATMLRLSGMMFLQSWPLGVWGVTVSTYLAANTGDAGDALYSPGFAGYSTAAGAIGGLVAPALVGYLSDRYFSAQRLLSVMHLGCAASAYGMYASGSQLGFFAALLVYFHCYVPAAALVNKIGLRTLSDVDAEFPRIRVFGAVGWITAGLFVGLAWPWLFGESIEATRTPLLIGAAASLAMALYALVLPHTPPEAVNPRSVPASPWRDAWSLSRNTPLMGFLLLTFLACTPSMAYNNFSNTFLNYEGYPSPAALLTLGQLSELITLWTMPWLMRVLRLRGMFLLGLAAWAARYACLMLAAQFSIAWLVIAAILLHGPCFAYVYTGGQMLTDRLVDPSRRGAAQGLFAVASLGLANLSGAAMVGLTQQAFLTPAGVAPPPYNWTAFWLIPLLISCGVAVACARSLRTMSDGPRDQKETA